MEFLSAFVICAAAAAVEGLCAGRDPMGQLKTLRQPSWSPPNSVWVLIGIAWYAIYFTGLVRLLSYWPEEKRPIILLIALMLGNTAANVPLFRIRRLDIAFFFFFPYWLLLAAFLSFVCPHGILTCCSRSTRSISFLPQLGATSFGG